MRVLMITCEWPTAEQPALCAVSGPTGGIPAQSRRRHRGLFVPRREKSLSTIFAPGSGPEEAVAKLLRFDPRPVGSERPDRAADPAAAGCDISRREGEGIVGDNGRYTLSGFILRLVSSFVARRADELIVVSAHMRRYLPRRTIHVVPSGLDFSRCRCCRSRKLAVNSACHRTSGWCSLPATRPRLKRYSLARDIVSRLDRSLDAELVVAWRVAHE